MKYNFRSGDIIVIKREYSKKYYKTKKTKIFMVLEEYANILDNTPVLKMVQLYGKRQGEITPDVRCNYRKITSKERKLLKKSVFLFKIYLKLEEIFEKYFEKKIDITTGDIVKVKKEYREKGKGRKRYVVIDEFYDKDQLEQDGLEVRDIEDDDTNGWYKIPLYKLEKVKTKKRKRKGDK